jgi:hypothetical protein
MVNSDKTIVSVEVLDNILYKINQLDVAQSAIIGKSHSLKYIFQTGFQINEQGYIYY